VSSPLSRMVLVARDIELRIVSLYVRCKEMVDEVVFLDTGSNDETMELATEVGCKVYNFTSELTPQSVSEFLLANDEMSGKTLVLEITDQWKLSDLPLSVNRARESWDIHFAYHLLHSQSKENDDVVLNSTMIQHLVLSQEGVECLAALSPSATSSDVPKHLRVRFIQSERPINLPQRESLATASRFAQLFYWMLESKHPLLLFGIPGVVLFVLGYRLSGDLATIFTELNTTSIGVTLATIAMTLIGLFAMMVALILYIMGKQVERIQHQYNWPKDG